MPTPLEILFDPGSFIVYAMFGGLVLWERLAPGRPLPKVRGWAFKGLGYFFGFFLLSSYLPLLWDRHLARLQWFDLTALGTAGGLLVGVCVYELVTWLWHRAMHRYEPLWRFHQTHHSAERLDVFSAFLFNPLDMIGWTLLSSLSAVVLVGITPEAATYLTLLVTWCGLFQHANIKTPRWLGYIIQRPESHTVHHARNIHHKNYADLPVFDMLFGTFENPTEFEHETGLYPGASGRNLDLLLLRNLTPRRRSSNLHTPAV